MAAFGSGKSKVSALGGDRAVPSISLPVLQFVRELDQAVSEKNQRSEGGLLLSYHLRCSKALHQLYVTTE